MSRVEANLRITEEECVKYMPFEEYYMIMQLNEGWTVDDARAGWQALLDNPNIQKRKYQDQWLVGIRYTVVTYESVTPPEPVSPE